MYLPITHVEDPETAGFSTLRLERLDNLFRGYVTRGELPGMIATVARRGKTVYYQKFGWKDIETQKPMRADTIFMIASMTKPITAVAAMMLYEEGYFQLNTPVSTFLPGFKDVMVYAGGQGDQIKLTPLDREITFRHLFTHTAGLSYGWDESDPLDRLYQQAQQKYQQQGLPFTNQALAEELSHLPLAFQPGTHWRYSLSIDVLGALVEIISGQPLDQYLQGRIFDPLGMPDTAFFIPSEKLNRVAAVYGHPNPEEGLKRMEAIKPETAPPAFASGGGGLVSTIGDYSRFCQMMVDEGEFDGHRLLSPKTVELFAINHCPPETLPYAFEVGSLYHAGYGYSLGIRVLMDVSQSGIAGSPGEFGWDGAYSTYFWIDPLEKLYGLLMLQHSPNAYYPIHQQFKQLTYQAIIA